MKKIIVLAVVSALAAVILTMCVCSGGGCVGCFGCFGCIGCVGCLGCI